jgi:2-succinyl-6-hydroxy-2,4-cyclohexadiene-1-carboxylate synthase
MPDAWARLGELALPTLVVTGADDAKYGEIAAGMHRRNRRLEHVILPGGHALPLAQPVAVAECLNRFAHEVGSATE